MMGNNVKDQSIKDLVIQSYLKVTKTASVTVLYFSSE